MELFYSVMYDTTMITSLLLSYYPLIKIYRFVQQTTTNAQGGCFQMYMEKVFGTNTTDLAETTARWTTHIYTK